MYNKNKFNKVNDKKVLHKVKKQWVTMSIALFALIGGGALASHVSASADQMNNNNNSNNNSNTIHINNDNPNQRNTNDLNIAGKAKEMHQRLLFNADNQADQKNNLRLGSWSKATRQPAQTKQVTVNNKPIHKINSVNRLKSHRTGVYHNYVYSRINLPFHRVRLNNTVELHSSVDFDNSKVYGKLFSGQIVRVHRAFKEYGHYNNYLRYEIKFAHNRFGFITGNPDFVSYVLPSKNYKQYQHATAKLLKSTNNKNTTKISKKLSKLVKRHNHNYRKYARLYAMAMNTKQNYQYPISVDYHSKQGQINNRENIAFNHSRANVTVPNSSSNNTVSSLENNVSGNSNEITPESNTVIPSSSTTSNSFNYTPTSSINVIPTTSTSSSAVIVPSFSSQSSAYIPASSTNVTPASTSSSASVNSSSESQSSMSSSASVNPSSKASSVSSNSSSATSKVSSKATSQSSKASVTSSSTNSSASSKAAGQNSKASSKPNSSNSSSKSVNPSNKSTSNSNNDKHIYTGTYKGLMYRYNPTTEFLDFTGGTANSDFNLSDYFLYHNINIKSIKFENNIDISKVSDMSHMFAHNNDLQSLNLGNKFDTSNVSDMSGMFESDYYLQSLNLGNKFDTSNVSNMNHMFSEDSLQSLNLGNKFDTSKVSNMSDMFSWDHLQSLNLGNKFDTSKVSNMSDMFLGDSDLQSLNLGNKFDTSKVSDMSDMFSWDFALQSLNLGNKFDTSKVFDMSDMFERDSALQSLNLGNKFNTSNVTGTLISDMFESDKNLHSIILPYSFYYYLKSKDSDSDAASDKTINHIKFILLDRSGNKSSSSQSNNNSSTSTNTSNSNIQSNQISSDLDKIDDYKSDIDKDEHIINSESDSDKDPIDKRYASNVNKIIGSAYSSLNSLYNIVNGYKKHPNRSELSMAIKDTSSASNLASEASSTANNASSAANSAKVRLVNKIKSKTYIESNSSALDELKLPCKASIALNDITHPFYALFTGDMVPQSNQTRYLSNSDKDWMKNELENNFKSKNKNSKELKYHEMFYYQNGQRYRMDIYNENNISDFYSQFVNLFSGDMSTAVSDLTKVEHNNKVHKEWDKWDDVYTWINNTNDIKPELKPAIKYIVSHTLDGTRSIAGGLDVFMTKAENSPDLLKDGLEKLTDFIIGHIWTVHLVHPYYIVISKANSSDNPF